MWRNEGALLLYEKTVLQALEDTEDSLVTPARARDRLVHDEAAVQAMQDALTQLVNHIAVSYSLAYLPTNSARDGKRRRIRIQLSPDVEPREGKIVLLTRRSYIMPKEVN